MRRSIKVSRFVKMLKSSNINVPNELVELHRGYQSGRPFPLQKEKLQLFKDNFVPVDNMWWCSSCEFLINSPEKEGITEGVECPKCNKNTLEYVGVGFGMVLEYLFTYNDQVLMGDIYISREDLFAALL